MLWYVRAPSWDQLEKFRERVFNCFQCVRHAHVYFHNTDNNESSAAALATSCKIKITKHQPALDLRQNLILCASWLISSRPQRY
jgi:hypothetical protein